MYIGLSGKDKCAECGNDTSDMFAIQLFSSEAVILMCRKCMVRLMAMVAKVTAANKRVTARKPRPKSPKKATS